MTHHQRTGYWLLSGLLVVMAAGRVHAETERAVPAAPKEAPVVQVLVDNVTDTRAIDSFFGKCEVQLKVMGDAVGDSLGIRAIRVVTAVDDTGRELKTEKEGLSFFSQNTDHKNMLTEKVSLKNPARSAKMIQLLQGEVELFHPTPENGGVVTVGGFLAKPGETLGASALGSQHVSVMYLTKELLEAKKQEMQDKAKAKTDTEMKQAGRELGEAFGKLFTGMFSGMMDESSSVKLWIEDPEKRVVDIAFLDASGKPLSTNGRTSMGEFRSFSFKTWPAPDTRLVIYLASPGAVTSSPFTLHDIPLP